MSAAPDGNADVQPGSGSAEADAMSFFRLLRRWSRAEWMAASAALFCCVVGVLDMLAWHLHLVPWLTYPAGSMPMVHNTALLFFLSGISVLAVLARWPRMGLWIGIVVAAIAAAVELQYLANVDFGIDQLLCRAYLPGFSHPGGMAPNTALCFIAAGAALALANGRWRFALRAPLIGLLGSAVAVLGLAALLGYAISLATAYTWIASTPMALLTAVSLVIAATMRARPMPSTSSSSERRTWSIRRRRNLWMMLSISAVVVIVT